MSTLIEQIRRGIHTDFLGGIHPPEQKHPTNATAILPPLIPPTLVLPLKQHVGIEGKVLVNIGDHVDKGQVLTASESQQACAIHAPTSGEIIAIESRPLTHPSGLTGPCIVLKPDLCERWGEKKPLRDYRSLAPQVVIDHIQAMGIAGLGGAGFPTARKLQSGLAHTQLIIINGAECEPYITADDRLMQEKAAEIIQGVDILSHITNAELTVIAIEDNKPQAIAAITDAIAHLSRPNDGQILIKVIPTKYPSGGEKQLIKLVTNLEIGTQSLPTDMGILMQNVGTLYAIKRAVIDGEPLIERVVTLVGKCLTTQANRWALLGTPIDFLLSQHGYQPDPKLARLIIGGPMMGFNLPQASSPITKITNCILVPSAKEIAPPAPERTCIRCAACADVCPARLLPQQLQWYAKEGNLEKCDEYNLFDCIECGACAYVCPSDIPLVQYYRQTKVEIRAQQAEQQAAERAKARFDAKKARMAREKQDREMRHQQAAQERRQAMAGSEQTQSDAISAAIERVKAKNATATSEVKPAVAAAIARAKAKQAQAAAEGQTVPDNSEMIALRAQRKAEAQAHKAAQQATDNLGVEYAEPDTPAADDPKKAAVAAAIARAKARKAAQPPIIEANEVAAEDAMPTAIMPVDAAADDPKKAAVAAAIARAKARKAAQQASTSTHNQDDNHKDT